MPPLPETDESQKDSEVTFDRVYEELRCLAKSQMAREYAYSTLQATALLHEAWVRVGGAKKRKWKNRRHLFGAVSQAMRRILVERARMKGRIKNGGKLVKAVDADVSKIPEEAGVDRQLVVITDAMDKFEAFDPRKAELVRLRYFFGLSFEEAAAMLNISQSTAKRWWAYSRSWLHREISRK